MAASTEAHNQPERYEIRIKGHLDERWTGRFGGMTISLEDGGSSLLAGPVADQAALYGLLRKVRDLGMPLLSVMAVDPDQAHANETCQYQTQKGDE